MKVLINSQFKALMKGNYVEASPDANESVISSDDDIAVSAMREIAQANGVNLHGSKTKEKIQTALFDGLKQLEIPNVTEKTDSQKVNEIVKAGLEAGQSEDQILVSIVNSGIKFSAANKYYKQALKDSGMYISPKERKEQVGAILTEMDFAPESYSDVEDAAKKLAEEVKDTDNKKAIALIRSWCKANEVEMPKRTRGVGSNRSSLRSRSFDWLCENPGASQEEFTTWLVEAGGKEKHVKNFWQIVEFARRYAEVVEVA